MITWKDFQRLMPWEIVILVGGGYALAAGCKVLRIYVCVFLYYSTALGIIASGSSESAIHFHHYKFLDYFGGVNVISTCSYKREESFHMLLH